MNSHSLESSHLVGESSVNKGTDLDVLNGGGRGYGDEDDDRESYSSLEIKTSSEVIPLFLPLFSFCIFI